MTENEDANVQEAEMIQGPGSTREPEQEAAPTKEQREGACAQAVAEVLKRFGCRIDTRMTLESVGEDGSGRSLISTQIRVRAS